MKIEVFQGPTGYIARVHHKAFMRGATIDEAIFNLLKTHPEIFDIEIEVVT